MLDLFCGVPRRLGFSMCFACPGTVFAWSSKVLRAGMGAHFLLGIYEDVEPANCCRGLLPRCG